MCKLACRFTHTFPFFLPYLRITSFFRIAPLPPCFLCIFLDCFVLCLINGTSRSRVKWGPTLVISLAESPLQHLIPKHSLVPGPLEFGLQRVSFGGDIEWPGDIGHPLLGRTDHLGAPRAGRLITWWCRAPQATPGHPGGPPTQHAMAFSLLGFHFMEEKHRDLEAL